MSHMWIHDLENHRNEYSTPSISWRILTLSLTLLNPNSCKTTDTYNLYLDVHSTAHIGLSLYVPWWVPPPMECRADWQFAVHQQIVPQGIVFRDTAGILHFRVCLWTTPQQIAEGLGIPLLNIEEILVVTVMDRGGASPWVHQHATS